MQVKLCFAKSSQTIAWLVGWIANLQIPQPTIETGFPHSNNVSTKNFNQGTTRINWAAVPNMDQKGN